MVFTVFQELHFRCTGLTEACNTVCLGKKSLLFNHNNMGVGGGGSGGGGQDHKNTVRNSILRGLRFVFACCFS